jgi:hypothetical protein
VQPYTPSVRQSPAEWRRRIETIADRISKLSAAILCISASLDLETVLREIVDSARELTGARFGLITTVAGQPQDFVTAGLTEDEHAEMAAWSDGTAAVRAIPGPSRAVAGGRPAGLRPGARLLDGGDSVEDVAVRADAPPRRARRQLLARGEGGRARVHGRRRGSAGAVRVAGSDPPVWGDHVRLAAGGAFGTGSLGTLSISQTFAGAGSGVRHDTDSFEVYAHALFGYRRDEGRSGRFGGSKSGFDGRFAAGID